MLNHIDVPILIGGMVGIIGAGMVVWPRAVLEVSQDADGKPMRVTPSNAIWMRVAGVALLALGAILIASELAGAPRAVDPVQF
jgi:hypothetical protein